jgi:hypothetical protein
MAPIAKSLVMFADKTQSMHLAVEATGNRPLRSLLAVPPKTETKIAREGNPIHAGILCSPSQGENPRAYGL